MAGEDPEEKTEETNTEDEQCYVDAEVLFFDNHDCQCVHSAGIFIHIYSFYLFNAFMKIKIDQIFRNLCMDH